MFIYECIGTIIVLLILTLFVCSCKKEQDSVLTVDFAYKVIDDNYTVPARVQITNATSGALFYKWTFENANITTYDKKDPGEIFITNPGAVKIRLEAWNDDQRLEKQVEIIFDTITKANFIAVPRINNIAPAEFDFQFTGQGATAYQWTFENANILHSTDRNPSAVKFSSQGTYKVFLQCKNQRGKTDTITKWVTVRQPLIADFDIDPSFDDDDYEAPLVATLSNHSVSATQHLWTASGGTISSTTDSIPMITFQNPGTYTVTYKADNSKQTATITKTIHVKPNSGLRTFNNIKLGINTAHGSVGAFFSTKLRKVITSDMVTSVNGPLIDVCYFGLSSSFNYNKFIGPNTVQSYTFSPIPGATNTVYINRQESCGCIGISAPDFDAMVNGNDLNAVPVSSFADSFDFDNSIVPRVVLFQNAAGKKGAIKVKQYVSNGAMSYIICDIKIQKD